MKIAIFLIALASSVKGQLRSADVSEGACVDIPRDTKVNPLFIFGVTPYTARWYVPMASQFGLRLDAEAMLGGRSLADEDEFKKLQSSTGFPYFDLKSPRNALPFSVGAVYGFNDTRIIKNNCYPTNYIEMVCDCINTINIPIIGNITVNGPDIYCKDLDPHKVTIIASNEVEGYWIANVCPANQQRYWMAFSRTKTLTPNAQEMIKATILATGHFNESLIAYQYYD